LYKVSAPEEIVFTAQQNDDEFADNKLEISTTNMNFNGIGDNSDNECTISTYSNVSQISRVRYVGVCVI